jgi:hypothetical protein
MTGLVARTSKTLAARGTFSQRGNRELVSGIVYDRLRSPPPPNCTRRSAAAPVGQPARNGLRSAYPENEITTFSKEEP